MTALALLPFTDFADAFALDKYRAVPNDWFVAVTDVVDSTQAIARGRYKDVNMAGAATIAGVLNACGRDDLPFAFGGDGGVVLAPPEFAHLAAPALRATQKLCAETMGLTLRGALIPVSEIRKQGRDILVAAHNLGSGRMLAMMAGGGMEIAETLCKSPAGTAFAVSAGEGESDLTGLSCRWQPFQPQRGTIMALMVRARDETSALPSIYRELYARINAVLGADYSPAKAGNSPLRWPPPGMALEAAMQGRAGRFKRKMRILFEETVGLMSLASGKTLGGFNARAYYDSLPRHTDYRKYADSLRMVVDCTDAQAYALRVLLDAEWRRGTIDYGTHVARSALMTCFVKNTQESKHIHFIDGADGGYALAALDMKKRMATENSDQNSS